MKAILYVGGALMVAASIYGFIDYKKSSQGKNFRTLYENKREVSVPVDSRASKALKEEAVKVAEESSLDANEKETNTNSSTATKTSKKKRKISVENYSRAPLDEKYLKKEKKTEPKKIEMKEL